VNKTAEKKARTCLPR